MKRTRATAFFALFLLAVQTAAALSLVEVTDDALVLRSQGAAVVKVRDVLQNLDGDRATHYLVEVQRQLSGPALDSLEVLGLPGTFNAPNTNFIVDGIPRLEPGDTWLVLFRRNEQGILTVTELVQGLFREVDAGGRRAYLGAVQALGDHGKGANSLVLRDAEAFEDWLSLSVMKRGRSADAGYRFKLDRSTSTAKFMLAQFGLNPPGPGRWFQFDTLQSLPWTIGSPGQAGVGTSALQTMVTQALDGWVDDPGSDIFMHLAGTSGDNLLNNTGFSAKIVWNRDLASSDCSGGTGPAGPYNCISGTLAIGGSFATSANPGTVLGTSYYRRLQGFVCVRENVSCVLNGNGGADGAELIAHEVGHVLALAHSCNDGGAPACSSSTVLDEALMRPFIHRDGRGAQLGSDDRAGMAQVYPAAAPPDVGPSLSATSPLTGSSTSLGGGIVGANVSGSINFSVSMGSGAGTTALACNVSSGTVQITGNASQPAIAVNGSASPVGVGFVLTNQAQSGVVSCIATRQNAASQNFSFTFTAQAGTDICTGDCIFRNSFE